MNNDLTCSCSCTPDSTPTDTSPDFLYAHQSPYPPVCIKEQNPLYGRMMLDNMGGQESEMSTIGLYIYNSIFLTSDTARIAEIFKNISIVEMHHLKIFGQLADQLGESPRLWTHRQNRMFYWTAGYINYFTDLPKILLSALNGEKLAVRKYREQCQRIQDEDIQKCLKRIILDEELHIEILESLCKKYPI